MSTKHDIRVLERHASGIANDIFFIKCDGVVYKRIYDCRYFDDQVAKLFEKEHFKEEGQNGD